MRIGLHDLSKNFMLHLCPIRRALSCRDRILYSKWFTSCFPFKLENRSWLKFSNQEPFLSDTILFFRIVQGRQRSKLTHDPSSLSTEVISGQPKAILGSENQRRLGSWFNFKFIIIILVFFVWNPSHWGSVLNYDYILKLIVIIMKSSVWLLITNCERIEFDAGLALGEGFGRDVQKIGKITSDFQLQNLIFNKIKSETE